MPAGRPTKYTPELLAKAREYLESWDFDGDVIPSDVGLAHYIDISTVTLYDWIKQEGKEEFSNIVRKVEQKQFKILAAKGLIGDFNASITKLMLTKHGLSDKQLLGSDPDNPLPTSIKIEYE